MAGFTSYDEASGALRQTSLFQFHVFAIGSEGADLGSYRSRFDIIAKILDVASQGAKKTKIMYQANLSYKLLTSYLTEVRKACLVRFDHRERCYVLTSKGREYLERYKEFSRHNKHVEKQLNDLQDKKKLLIKLCSSS